MSDRRPTQLLFDNAISIVGVLAVIVLLFNARAFGPAPTKDLWFDVLQPTVKGKTP